MRSIFVFLLLFSFIFSNSYAGFSPNTVVLGWQGFMLIGQLQKDSYVTSYDLAKKTVVQGAVSNHRTYTSSLACKVICDEDISFVASPDQIVMTNVQWRVVKDLKKGDRLKCCDSSHATVLSVEAWNDEQLLCEITVEPYHTFCVTPRGVIVHNNEFAALGGAVAGTLTLTAVAVPVLAPIMTIIKGASIVGILGVGLWRSFENKKKEKARRSLIESSGGCPSPPPPKKPRNKDEYNSMYEVFERAPIGDKLKKVTQETSFERNGSKIYKVIEDVQEWGIKKGDWLYLDRMHKDHIEVFKRCGKIMRTVLNMDGTQNLSKLRAAGARDIVECIN